MKLPPTEVFLEKSRAIKQESNPIFEHHSHIGGSEWQTPTSNPLNEQQHAQRLQFAELEAPSLRAMNHPIYVQPLRQFPPPAVKQQQSQIGQHGEEQNVAKVVHKVHLSNKN